MRAELDEFEEFEEDLEGTPTAEGRYLIREIVVDEGQSALRIDKLLASRLEGASRSFIQKALEAEMVAVAGRTVRPSYRVKPGEVISIYQRYAPRGMEVLPEDIPLDVVYEDAHMLVVNKPAGMVVHPGHGHFSGTLVNALLYYLRDLPLFQQGGVRPGLAHRIDKDTSGLLVIGKTEEAMSRLGIIFQKHEAHRSYEALAWGLRHMEVKGQQRAPRDRDSSAPAPTGRTCCSPHRTVRVRDRIVSAAVQRRGRRAHSPVNRPCGHLWQLGNASF